MAANDFKILRDGVYAAAWTVKSGNPNETLLVIDNFKPEVKGPVIIDIQASKKELIDQLVSLVKDLNKVNLLPILTLVSKKEISKFIELRQIFAEVSKFALIAGGWSIKTQSNEIFEIIRSEVTSVVDEIRRETLELSEVEEYEFNAEELQDFVIPRDVKLTI